MNELLLQSGRKFITLMVLSFLFALPVLASDAGHIIRTEDIPIHGKVTDDQNLPLPGVTVKVQGKQGGAISDANGNYKITAPANAVLIFSYIGYATKNVPVNSRAIIDVKLASESKQLEEQIVIGYGTVKKSDLTGSIASVKSKDFEQQASLSIADALQGKAAGVTVSSTDGAPGGGIKISVRGSSSITASNAPLYVIDGFPVISSNPTFTQNDQFMQDSFNPLANLAPDDIESIEVLKDASSTAIYGSRGANGVILVTTKKGKGGRSTIAYNAYVGLQNMTRPFKMMNSTDYARLKNATQSGAPYANYASYADSATTNWQAILFRTALQQNHRLNMSGGLSDKGTYNLSMGFADQQGILLKTDFKRYDTRLNINTQVLPKVTLTSNLAFARNITDGTLASAASDGTPGVISQGLYGPPNRSQDIQYFDNQTDVTTAELDQYSNPLIFLNNYSKVRQADNVNWNTGLSYNLLPNLTISTKYGFNVSTTDQNEYFGKLTAQGAVANGIALVGNNKQTGWVNENILNYNSQISRNSHLSLTGGVTFQSNTSTTVNTKYSQFTNDVFTYNRLQDASVITLPITKNIYTKSLESGLFRASYSLKDKYLITASFRADGSSVFGNNNKWGYFPSVSGAWRIIDEPFMKKQDILSDLKLRAGYGITGNDQIPNFASQAILGINNYTIGTGEGTVTALLPLNAQNDNLKWETTRSYNLGLDLGLLKNRISLTADYYQNYTSNMLLNVTLPGSSGFANAIINIGSKQNRGIELSISSKNITKGNFRWSTDFNISRNIDKITGLGYSNEIPILIPMNAVLGNTTDAVLRVGQPIGTWYGYVDDGIYQISDFQKVLDNTGKEIPWSQVDWHKVNVTGNYTFVLKPGVANSTVQKASPAPGDRKYKDLNADGVVNDKDRQIIGAYQPMFTGGFANSFSYRSFDLNIFISYRIGGKIYNANRMQLEGTTSAVYNSAASFNNRWQPPSYDATGNEIPGTGNPTNDYIGGYNLIRDNLSVIHSSFLEDGSFLRVSTISLGYNLKKAVLSGIGLANLKIYGTVNNAFLITKYTGYDPEVSTGQGGTGNTAPGLDLGGYPKARTFILGVNASF